jgi:hypothetical protein
MSESQIKENAAAVGKLFGTAAKLAQKQAALATLNNVTLPKLYHAIGKKIIGLEKLPPDLTTYRDKIRTLEAGIAAKSEEPKAAPAEGFAAKAKQFAQQAAQKASKASADAAATMQIQATYVSLGKAAVEKYGDKAIPKEMADEFRQFHQSRDALNAEIESLAATSRVGFLTPRRILFGLLTVACLGLVAFMWPTGDRATSPVEQSGAEDMDFEQELRKLRDVANGATGADDFDRGRAKAKLRDLGYASEDSSEDASLEGLPSHLERHRKAVLILKSIYADSGQPNVSMDELTRAMNILANGTMLNGTKAKVENLLTSLQQYARKTGKGIEQILEEMCEHKTASMSHGLGEAFVERSHIDRYKDAPVRDPGSDQRPTMICPSCKGTGSTNPDNPSTGSLCLVCGGKGQRRVGR